MSDSFQFNVYVAIKDGRQEDFKRIAKEWSAHHRAERPDILSYEWYFLGEDETRALVLETYANSEGMLATMEQVSEAENAEAPDYPYEMIKIEVCGNISDALRAKLDAGDSKIDYYRHVDGFTR